MIAASIGRGPRHTVIDTEVRVLVKVPTVCGLDLPWSLLSPSSEIACGDCTRIEALRLAAAAREMAAFGYRSIEGYCRHGAYVGGSGIDWMCGTCEMYSLDEEVADIRKYAADVLRKAVYS